MGSRWSTKGGKLGQNKRYLDLYFSLAFHLLLDEMRTFIALELPKDLKEEIGRFQEGIKKFLPLRFVHPENLHLTLFFLGEIEETRIPEAVEAVRAGTRGIKPFYLFLGKPGFFSHGLWLEVEGQIEVLRKLHLQIKKELEARNFELEKRLFSPHITIGRSKKRIKGVVMTKSIVGIRGRFKANSVSVFASELKPEGPIYSKIKEISLE